MSRLTLRNENGELYVSIENKNPPYPLVTDEVIEKLGLRGAKMENMENFYCLLYLSLLLVQKCQNRE